MPNKITRIQVLYGYRGRPTAEQFLPAGDYSADDPRVNGAAAYLVANGHAIVTGAVDVAEADDVDVVEDVDTDEGDELVEVVGQDEAGEYIERVPKSEVEGEAAKPAKPASTPKSKSKPKTEGA